MSQLCKIEEVAEEWGVPKASLKTAAQNHGFIVRIGRAMRLERDRLPELLKKCRDTPKEQGSTNSRTARTGTSETRDSATAQRAAQAASKLKKPSRRTSPQEAGKVLRMSRKT